MTIPRYVERFRCVGGVCPDTCCAGWSVYLDRETYALYESVTQEPLRTRIQQCVSPAERGDALRFGKIVFASDGATCGMRTTDGLCAIQAELGEGALSNVCDVFPRMTCRFGSRIEQSLSFSCPEALRLALETPDAMAWCEAEIPVRPETLIDVPPVAGFELQTMQDMRLFTLQLMQTAEIPLLEKLGVLGWICSRADELSAESRLEQIVGALLQESLDLIESGAFTAFFSDMPDQVGVSANVFSLLLGPLAGKGGSIRQRDVLRQVATGLGLAGAVGPDPAQIEMRYRRGLATLDSSAADVDRLLGIFLINEMLRDVFPWGHGPVLLKSFRRLVISFGTLRLMLAGAAASTHESLNMEQMASVVQVHARLFMHDAAFFERGERLLVGSECGSIDRLCRLLK